MFVKEKAILIIFGRNVAERVSYGTVTVIRFVLSVPVLPVVDIAIATAV